METLEIKNETWGMFGRCEPVRPVEKPTKAHVDLYFIQADCPSKYIKVGIATNVKARLSELQVGCPYPLSILKTIPGGSFMEKEIHKEFADWRVSGEWFKPSPTLIALIEILELDPQP